MIDSLLAALGPDLVCTAPIEPRYHSDESGAGACEPLAVLLPRTTEHVSTALAICDEHRQSVVAQGGRSGLTGAAIPGAGDVVLSLERLRGVIEIDPDAATMTVWAGTTLEAAQQAAAEAGFELTYDLGARGSCTVGGNIATNAGGNRVIRYGMTREHVLGLEAVLADGTVVTSLNKMLKNNAGYDLKQLFIGSEGTLGVVTRAVLRLRPAPRSRTTSLIAAPDYPGVLALLRHAQTASTGVTAFEVMWPPYYQALATIREVTAPVEIGDGFGVLLEITGADPDTDADAVECLIAEAVEHGWATDAFIARSARDTEAIWGMREAGPLTAAHQSAHFDIGLPIGSIADFVVKCTQQLRDVWPDVEVLPFGHIGDSNLHLQVWVGDQTGDLIEAIDDVVYAAVRDWGGSVSAEHGIGTLKRAYLGHSRSDTEIALMHRLKAALDPNGILNPGKVI